MEDPTNIIYVDNKKKTMIIPVYIGIVIKGVSNIIVHAGKIDYNYTLVIRIPKSRMEKLALDTICSGIKLRVNDILIEEKESLSY